MSADVITLERPADVSDGRWERIQVEAQRIVTGHYPWCEDHQDDEEGGYCYRAQKTPFGSIDMGNGTADGSVILSIDVVDGDGHSESVTEMSVATAACIASLLDAFTRLAFHGGVKLD